MSDKPNRRILDRPTGALSLLASGSRVTGDIETPGALMIGCHVRGDGNIGGELSISAEAHWEHTRPVGFRVARNVVRRAEARFRARLDSHGTGESLAKGGDRVCSDNQRRLA
jgi:hypothetical protein